VRNRLAILLRIVKELIHRRDLQSLVLALTCRPFFQDASQDPFHLQFQYFVQEINKRRGYRILELGSRMSKVRGSFENYQEYTGFDIHAGEGVEVVGDIHKLSQYFPKERFDAVFSVSVFEHLAMPWKAVLEINKVMKEGGLLFIATHPAWPPHSLPWDFWRFPKGAFSILLNTVTGFSILKCEEGIPCTIFPFSNEANLKNYFKHTAYLGVSVVAEKTGESDSRLSWNVEIEEMLDSMYPEKDR
jgi:SAM-dependent methyltransferase